jgi:SAM-dependent methyltransferase
MKSWSEFYKNKFSIRYYLGTLYCHSLFFEEVRNDNPHNLLEVGVGSGTTSILMSYFGYHVTGLDNDSAILEEAKYLNRSLNGKVEYVLGNAFELVNIFRPDSFDIVFSQGFFEHFEDAEITELLRQQLTIGKKVIFSVPSCFYPKRDFGDERLLNINIWRKILKGFAVEDIRYYGFYLPNKKEVFNLLNPLFVYKTLICLIKEKSHILVKIKR